MFQSSAMATSHRSLANWYQQLAQHLEAGIPFPEAVELAAGPSTRHRAALAAQLRSAQQAPEHVVTHTAWLPRNDRPQLIAALHSSKLPETCQRLSEQHRTRHQLTVKLTLAALYPIALYHLAAIVLSAVLQLDFERGLSSITPDRTILIVAALILPFWTILATTRILRQIESPLLNGIIPKIPLLRAYSKAQSIAELAQNLGSLLQAGVQISTAWQIASTHNRTRKIRDAGKQIQQLIATGTDPSTALPQMRCFPKDFVTYYRSGAQTGKLDQSLLQIAQHYHQKANRLLLIACGAAAAVLFSLVIALVLYTVFSFYSSYLDTITQFS